MAAKILMWGPVALSIATGITKIIQLPAEMDLFQNAGWPVWLILMFGAVQIVGGILIIWLRTRRTGCVTMIATFTIASIVVWQNAMTGFFAVSLLFILLAAFPLTTASGLTPKPHGHGQ